MGTGSSSKAILVTGSNGLIGSEVCLYFAARGFAVSGIDNNQRAVFFGPQGDTRWNQSRLQKAIPDFHHYEVDVLDRARIEQTIKEVSPQLIVHAAAQPSHDLAASMPFEDFDTNAVGTLNLLEATRQDPLRLLCCFSSVAARHGNPGHVVRR